MLSPAIVGIIKHTSTLAVSSGVSTIVGYAAKNAVPKVAPALIRSRPILNKSFHLFQKVAIPAGAAALAGMVSRQAIKYTEQQIDEHVALFNSTEALVEETLNKVSSKEK